MVVKNSALREAQLGTIQKLWRRAASTTAEGRAGLPDRNDRAWFSSTFCSGADLGGLGESSSIWPYITGFPIYGPLALLAAQPLTLGRFFEVRTKIVGNAEHLVVGTSEDETGVRDSRALRAFVMDALRYALSESLTHALSTAAAISERKDDSFRPPMRKGSTFHGTRREGSEPASPGWCSPQ